MITLLIFLQAIFTYEIPNGFKRQPVDEFGKYIQTNLLKQNQESLIHDGRSYKEYTFQSKNGSDFYNLENSADGVIRLRWEYYLNNNKFSRISFKQKSGKEVKYNFSSKGYFIKFFETWERLIGIDNLIDLTVPQNLKNLKTGDVLVGDDDLKTCLIILDVIKDNKGNIQLLLGQSFTQDRIIHISKGHNTNWIPVKDGLIIANNIEYKISQIRTWKM
jgi:hypothetical protein